jgi:hypothetical protein
MERYLVKCKKQIIEQYVQCLMKQNSRFCICVCVCVCVKHGQGTLKGIHQAVESDYFWRVKWD